VGPVREQARNGNGTTLDRVRFGGKTRSPAAVSASQSAGVKTPVSAICSTAVALRPGPTVTVRTGVCASRAAGLPSRRPARSTADTPGNPLSVQRAAERFVK
jgi:hypothetical protein